MRHATIQIHQKRHATVQIVLMRHDVIQNHLMRHATVQTGLMRHAAFHIDTIRSDSSHGGHGLGGQRRMKRWEYVGVPLFGTLANVCELLPRDA